MAIPSYLSDLINQYQSMGNVPISQQTTALAPQADIASRISAAGAVPQIDLSQLGQLFQSSLGGALDLARQRFGAQAAESGSGLQRGDPGVEQEQTQRYAAQSALANLFPAQTAALTTNVGNLMTGRQGDLAAYLTQLTQSGNVGGYRMLSDKPFNPYAGTSVGPGGDMTLAALDAANKAKTPGTDTKTPGAMTAPGGSAYNPGYGSTGSDTFGGQTADLGFMPSTGYSSDATAGLGGSNLWAGVDWNQAFPSGVPSSTATGTSGYGTAGGNWGEPTDTSGGIAGYTAAQGDPSRKPLYWDPSAAGKVIGVGYGG